MPSFRHSYFYDADIREVLGRRWERISNRFFEDRWGLTKRAVIYQLQRMQREGVIEMRYSRSGKGIRHLRLR